MSFKPPFKEFDIAYICKLQTVDDIYLTNPIPDCSYRQIVNITKSLIEKGNFTPYKIPFCGYGKSKCKYQKERKFVIDYPKE